MTTNPVSTEEAFRRVVAEIVLSLDGRVNGAGGEYDMSWLFPHAISVRQILSLDAADE
jgi:hypothetical protein